MHLSVIVPAYNEEKRIEKTLRDIHKYLDGKHFNSEILVVNNNSTDGTAQLVTHLQMSMPRLRLLHEWRAGKGHAVTKGMLCAYGQVRLFTDADNATPIEEFDKADPYLRKGYNVVIGSLAVPGSKVVHGGEEPFWRVLLGKLGNKWIQIFAVWGINDTQRGFKVFTEKAALHIFPKLTIFGWGFDVEVLALARKFRYKIKEIPITWNNDPNSHVNFWAYPQVLMQTVQVFINMHTGVYKKHTHEDFE